MILKRTAVEQTISCTPRELDRIDTLLEQASDSAHVIAVFSPHDKYIAVIIGAHRALLLSLHVYSTTLGIVYSHPRRAPH